MQLRGSSLGFLSKTACHMTFWLAQASRRSVRIVSTVFKLAGATPKGRLHLCEAFTTWLAMASSSGSSMDLRSADKREIRLQRPRTELLRLSPFYHGVSVLNSIPPQSKTSLSSVKSFLSSPDGNSTLSL